MTRVPSFPQRAVRVPALAVALVATLAACSGGGDSSAASPGPTASTSGPAASSAATETPTAAPETPTAAPVEPSGSPSSSAAETPEAEPTRLQIDDDVTGTLSLLGNGSIVVDTGKGTREAALTADTIVLDVQGSVCDKGAVPHRCTSAQLAKALKAGVSFEAKVLISDGKAVKVEEIVKD
ncbi:hypothetical protein AB0395_19485 [Streptosporangium sp. NPDC051023]|uniref:hypothetical protein n=1 Tax=Streptosporangium sp. NPDC051023 TaxID=3155410 RepID=UPI00344DC74A